MRIFNPNFGVFKKGCCVLKDFNLKERHVIFSAHFFGLKGLLVKTKIYPSEAWVDFSVNSRINAINVTCSRSEHATLRVT